MMMMYSEMRTCLGIHFLKAATRKLEPMSTNRVAPPITRALMAELVTASIGHMPSTWTNTGLSRQIPLTNSW